MRILKYLKGHGRAVLAIFALLVVLAFCDLSLPRYTADIVDVGIQQSGIEDAVPQQMSAETYGLLCAMLDDGSLELLEASYDRDEHGRFTLNSHGQGSRAELDATLTYPLATIAQLRQDASTGACQLTTQAEELAADQELQDAIELAAMNLESESEPIVRQQAIQAVLSEYKQMDVDVHGMQLSFLLSVGARMLGVTLLAAIASAAIAFVASRTGASIGRELRGRVFRQVVSFSDAEIQGFSAASLITRGTNDIQQIQMVTIIMLRMVLFAPILAIGGIIMVVRTYVSMSWIIIMAVAAVFCLVGALMVITMPKFKMMQKLIDRVNLVAREVIVGLPVIRAFNRQDYEELRFDKANRDLRDTQLFTNRAMAFMAPGMMLVMNGTSALIVWVSAGYIDAGTLQTGQMIAFITYSAVIIASFLMMSLVAILLPRAEVAAQRIDEVLACEPSIADPPSTKDAMLRASGGVEISFEDVSFSYPDAIAPALSHVSFTAKPGTTTAIIGATGSGKSTALRLIMRSYDVSDGKVVVDGIDVRDLSQKALRAMFGYVPQKAFLFSGTVASNVSYAEGEMDEQRIWRALEVAQARGFVSAREDGLETEVSQGGTDVSGGQRQRLAIARAFATDTRAFLFDDSFSALDYATDAALRNALRENLGDRTAIIVAQRISTIRHADNIVVLDEGRVVGQGTHAELMETCEQYREIASSQLSAAELSGGEVA